MNRIVKYICSILKDFIKEFIQAILLMFFIGVIAISTLFIFSILPIIVVNLTENIFLFILAYVIEFILLDLILDGQSDTVDYFRDKWRDLK